MKKISRPQLEKKVEEILNKIELKIIQEDLYLLENFPQPEIIRNYLLGRCKIHMRNCTSEDKKEYSERLKHLKIRKY